MIHPNLFCPKLQQEFGLFRIASTFVVGYNHMRDCGIRRIISPVVLCKRRQLVLLNKPVLMQPLRYYCFSCDI